MFNIRKTLVRIAVGLVMGSILAYISWPESKAVENTTETTITSGDAVVSATTQPTVDDAPCLVLYERDKDTMLMAKTPCIDTYVEKYKNSYYTKLNIICRSSGDGKAINRNALSEKRMQALQFNLMKLGVGFEDINARSVGDTQPYPGIDPTSDDGKIINRSCEITAIK